MQRREQDAKPIARSPAERLLESPHRLEENRQVEIQANDAYDKWWAERRAGGVPGQKLWMPPKSVTPPAGTTRDPCSQPCTLGLWCQCEPAAAG